MSWQLFGKIYEQLQDVEYYMLVQVYNQIVKQAWNSKTDHVKVKVPKLKSVIENWKSSKFMILKKSVDMQG